MRNFLKMFLAALLALIVFSIISFFFFVGWATSIASADRAETVGAKAVLTVDLSIPYQEKMQDNPMADFGVADEYDIPGLYDVVRMIDKASKDSAVKGIFIKANTNNNGIGASEELRNALIKFKTSGKWVYAYGDMISQKAYYVSSVADKIYCNPKGAVDWTGLAFQMLF